MRTPSEVAAHLEAIEKFGRVDEFVKGYVEALRWVLEKREWK